MELQQLIFLLLVVGNILYSLNQYNLLNLDNQIPYFVLGGEIVVVFTLYFVFQNYCKFDLEDSEELQAIINKDWGKLAELQKSNS